jgi:hypothetical protein
MRDKAGQARGEDRSGKKGSPVKDKRALAVRGERPPDHKAPLVLGKGQQRDKPGQTSTHHQLDGPRLDLFSREHGRAYCAPMAWMFPHTRGALLLRFKAGRWRAELYGRSWGSWPSPEEGVVALSLGATGNAEWDCQAGDAGIPRELAAWRQTYDAGEDPQPPSRRNRRSRKFAF